MPDDTHLTQRLVTELTTKAPMELVLAPASVFQLTALVQLALRHPGVSADLHATADRFLTGVRDYFADCPVALDLVRRGDDPREDQ